MKQTEEGSAVVDHDAALREFIYLASGRVIPAEQKLNLADICVPISESLIQRLAVIALATLAYKARRGSEKASIYLADRALGVCDKPFREKLPELTMDDARSMIIREFSESLNLSPDLAASMVDKMISGAE
jgi:hypothetical protein